MSNDQGQMPAINNYNNDEMEEVPHRKKLRTEGQGPAGNENPEQRKKYESLVDTSFFNELVGKEQFVDKTATMSEMFGEIGNAVILTAPSRYGKSVMISMFRLFMERRCGDNGERLAKELNPNFKLFENLAIAADKEFVDEHFGRYPVIHISLVSKGKIKTYEDALISLRFAIHGAYLSHKYLRKSHAITVENADEHLTDIIDLWIDKTTFRMTETDLILSALSDLARMLFIHHNEQCFVLVDEYDSIMDYVLGRVSNRDIEDICSLIADTISPLFKDENRKYVKGGIMAGISHLYGSAISDKTNNIRHCGFQKNHKFRNFFGLTQLEVESLLNTFDIKDRLGDVVCRFNGFIGEDNISLFNPWSTYNFVLTNELIDCWAKGRVIKGLKSSFRNESLRTKILQLIAGQMIPMKIFETLTVDHLQTINLLLSENPGTLEELDENVVLNLLFEQGFLTVDKMPEKNTETIMVKIPNDEIKQSFVNDLMFYCRKSHKVQMTVCKEHLLKVLNELNVDQDQDRANINAFLVSFHELLHQINGNFKHFQEINLHVAVALAFYSVDSSPELNPKGLTYASRQASSGRNLFTRPDVYALIENYKLCILAELKNEHSAVDAAQQMHDHQQLKIIKQSGHLDKVSHCLIWAIAWETTESGKNLTMLCDIRKVPEVLKYCDEPKLLATLNPVEREKVTVGIRTALTIDPPTMMAFVAPRT